MNIPTAPTATAPRAVLLIKSKIAHQAGFYLLNGRWHKIKQEKPVPKGAPQAAHPEAGGKHKPISLSAEQIDKLKYPVEKAATNKEMAAFNDVHLPKLLAHGENGDATAILGHGYGVNTHGKKQAAVANFLLGQMGSAHQVSPGQKPGEHAAVKGATQTEPKEPAGVTASSSPEALELLDKIKNAHSLSVADMYGQMYLSQFATPADFAAVKKAKAAQAQSMPAAKVARLGNAKEPEPVPASSEPAGGLKMPDFAEGKTTTGVKSHYEKAAQTVLDMAVDQDAVGLEDLKADGHKSGGKTWAGKTANSKKLLALHQAALQQIHAAWGHDDDELPAEQVKSDSKNPAAKHFGTANQADATEGEKRAINQYYAESQSDEILDIAEGLEVDGKTYSPAAQLYAQQALSELHPEQYSPPPVDATVDAPKAPAKAASKASKPKEPAKVTASSEPSPGAAKLDQIPWDGLKVDAANTNANTHNGKVEKIKALAYAGDVAGLQALKFGVNTYGKKQAKLAQAAIAALDPQAEVPKTPVAKKPAKAPAVDATPSIPTPPNLENHAGATVKKWFQAAQAEAPHTLAGLLDAYDNVMSSPTGKKMYSVAEATAMAGYADKLRKLLPKSAATEGPKDGDTKQGADGMLVFKDGHWHKQPEQGKGEGGQPKSSAKPKKPPHVYTGPAVGSQEAKDALVAWLLAGFKTSDKNMNALWKMTSHEAKQSIHSEAAAIKSEKVNKLKLSTVPKPDLAGVPNKGEVEQALAQLVSNVAKNGAPALKSVIVDDPAGVADKLVKLDKPDGNGSIVFAVFNNEPASPAQKVFKYALALGDELAPTEDGATKQGADGMLVFHNGHWHKMDTPQEPVTDVQGEAPVSMSGWKQVGGQLGSNAGGKFEDADGVAWYCKFPKDEDTAKSEVLAAKLYAAAGVTGQNCKLVTRDGKLGIASKWEQVTQAKPAELAKADGTATGFAVDAWLGNWDVVGLGYDNLQVGADGKAVRVDAGGSLEYRAQGGKKAFGKQVTEIDTMRDPKINQSASQVFGKLTKADITASVAKVAAVSDDAIYDLVMQYGPGDLAKKAHLVETLIARKENLLEQYPGAVKKAAAPKAKPKPDPTKLEVKAEDLPQPHDFHNWHGEGKGLSSKEHVNATNLKAEQDLLTFAAKGNLNALKDYHFDAVDKETGESSGSQHIEQHPSQHVKAYWSDLVSTLNYIAYPPEQLKPFKSVMAVGLKKVSDAFTAQKYGVTTNKVQANSRLAFWIALGHTKPVNALLPAGGSQTLAFQSNPVGRPIMTDAMRAQAKAAYAKLSSNRLVKRFINGIQSSGSYNDNFRDGLMVTNDGRDAVGMVLDAYSYAAEKPEGFEMYKWINFSGKMGQELLGAKPGTVFQNPGSMCCSYEPNATKGFGSDRIRIRYAKGAKAVDSFGSGSFAGEKEITTLPGQRFVIMSCQKVYDPLKGKERIELDVLMLPPDETYVSELETQKGKHGQS